MAADVELYPYSIILLDLYSLDDMLRATKSKLVYLSIDHSKSELFTHANYICTNDNTLLINSANSYLLNF